MMTSIMFPAVIVGGIGLICAIVLVVAAKVMALPADELFDSIRAELPGANCGACGYAGCDDYAKAVAHDGAKTNLCVRRRRRCGEGERGDGRCSRKRGGKICCCALFGKLLCN